jgi:hypothetical protein
MSIQYVAASFDRSSVRIPWIFASIAGLTLYFTACLALAATPSVLILIEKPSSMPASVRGEILAAATEGISLAGAVPRTTPRSQPPNTCATKSCFAELGVQHDAAFVLVLKAKVTRDSYQLDATIYEGKSGMLTASSEKDCILCSAPDFVASVRATVASLCQQVVPAIPEPTPAVPSAKAEPASIVNQPPVEDRPGLHVPRYLSVTTLVGGATLLGAGVYLLTIDGRGSCDLTAEQWQCPRLRSTKAIGTGLAIGGSAAAIGGLIGLIFFGPPSGTSPVALGFTGNSISARGAF